MSHTWLWVVTRVILVLLLGGEGGTARKDEVQGGHDSLVSTGDVQFLFAFQSPLEEPDGLVAEHSLFHRTVQSLATHYAPLDSAAVECLHQHGHSVSLSSYFDILPEHLEVVNLLQLLRPLQLRELHRVRHSHRP